MCSLLSCLLVYVSLLVNTLNRLKKNPTFWNYTYVCQHELTINLTKARSGTAPIQLPGTSLNSVVMQAATQLTSHIRKEMQMVKYYCYPVSRQERDTGKTLYEITVILWTKVGDCKKRLY